MAVDDDDYGDASLYEEEVIGPSVALSSRSLLWSTSWSFKDELTDQ